MGMFYIFQQHSATDSAGRASLISTMKAALFTLLVVLLFADVRGKGTNDSRSSPSTVIFCHFYLKQRIQFEWTWPKIYPKSLGQLGDRAKFPHFPENINRECMFMSLKKWWLCWFPGQRDSLGRCKCLDAGVNVILPRNIAKLEVLPPSPSCHKMEIM